MGDDQGLPELQVLTAAQIQQIDRKLAQAIKAGFGEIKLVVKGGRYRFIEGPAVSESVPAERE